MRGYDDNSAPAWAVWMNKSWPLFRAFGVQVRLSIWTILVPLIALEQFSRFGGLSSGEVFGLVLSHTIGLYLVIWTHEMGHIVAGRRYHIQTSLITLSPLGGLAHLQSSPPSPRAEIVIALAGPATHALWLALLWPLRQLDPSDSLIVSYTLTNLWWLNTGLALFNLLPFFPMDGGRVLRGLLALKWHPSRASQLAAKVGFFGALLFVLVGLSQSSFGGGLLVAIGLSNAISCWQELKATRYSSETYGESKQPWESDPDAWKSSPSNKDRHPAPKPSRRRPDDADAEPPKSALDHARLRSELDQLLIRVNEVGLQGLTAQERAQLERISQALRVS